MKTLLFDLNAWIKNSTEVELSELKNCKIEFIISIDTLANVSAKTIKNFNKKDVMGRSRYFGLLIFPEKVFLIFWRLGGQKEKIRLSNKKKIVHVTFFFLRKKVE